MKFQHGETSGLGVKSIERGRFVAAKERKRLAKGTHKMSQTWGYLV